VNLIVSDLLITDPGDLPHAGALRSKGRKLEQPTEPGGDFRCSVRRQGQTHQTIGIVWLGPFPEVARVHGDEGCFGDGAKQTRDHLVLDDDTGSQVGNEANAAPVLPLQNRFESEALQLLIEDDHSLELQSAWMARSSTSCTAASGTR
jgi:hypothetical protein